MGPGQAARHRQVVDDDEPAPAANDALLPRQGLPLRCGTVSTDGSRWTAPGQEPARQR